MPEAAFRQTVLEASCVGTWDLDVANDLFRCDAAAAAFYGLTPQEGIDGVPFARTAERIHPEDLATWRARRALSLRLGGVFVIEYRLGSPGGDIRWVLVRGRYDVGTDGRVTRGFGIVVDLTESKRDGFAEGQASMIGPPHVGRDDALETAAAHVLGAHRELSRIVGGADPVLLAAADRLLEEIGLAIARTQPSARPPTTRH